MTAQGEETTLESLRDKTVLIVNVASECGQTPQYEQLVELQKRYGPRGLQVLGFPCNQFGGQEPGSNEQIAEFCSTAYGVNFPVFAKIDVNGSGAHPIFQALSGKEDPEGKAGPVTWNFEKFLVVPGGEVLARFRSPTRPDDPTVLSTIENALGR